MKEKLSDIYRKSRYWYESWKMSIYDIDKQVLDDVIRYRR